MILLRALTQVFQKLYGIHLQSCDILQKNAFNIFANYFIEQAKSIKVDLILPEIISEENIVEGSFRSGLFGRTQHGLSSDGRKFLRAFLCFLSVAFEVKAQCLSCPALATIRAPFVHRAHSEGPFYSRDQFAKLQFRNTFAPNLYHEKFLYSRHNKITFF